MRWQTWRMRVLAGKGIPERGGGLCHGGTGGRRLGQCVEHDKVMNGAQIAGGRYRDPSLNQLMEKLLA